MRTERQRKIELLVRKNQAQREHPYYVTELSHILKQPLTDLDLYDLETTDNLLAEYNKNATCDDPKLTLKIAWPFNPNSRWIQTCFCLAIQLDSEPVALFSGPYELCGAVRTKAQYPLVNAASILTFDRDTLRIHSLNSDGGLYLDLYEENSKQLVELKIWGDWCSRTRSCVD